MCLEFYCALSSVRPTCSKVEVRDWCTVFLHYPNQNKKSATQGLNTRKSVMLIVRSYF